MPTYYYQFDLTTSSTSIATDGTVSDDGYDISEFDGDSRGTARVADWSDLSSMNETEYDIFLEVLSLVANSTFYVSWDGRGASYQNRNKYYWYNARARPFWARLSPSSSGGWHQTNLIDGALYGAESKNIVLGSWSPANLKALVFFPDYVANGGHETLTINT